ncbi:hypothetical protein NM688_g7881 [Phlebia brevispora]|uniref:Uncharacterized protein n=1 Tax=Phlebia brevispora TaxID=194682 RepID=A0ACC1S005_9APHY|nr:hypothetical protein NM688_g7881 [Phlebia brevispora]
MPLHVQTVFAKTVTPILQQLDATLLNHARSASRSILFSIQPSASIPADELSQLVSYFRNLKHERVGGLFAPMTLWAGNRDVHTGTWCSVAVFDRRTATPFYSDIPGEPAVQVGRWHASRQTVGHKGYDQRGTPLSPSYPRPAGLETLDPRDVKDVLYISDNAPEGLASYLASTFPRADQLGLIASSTPFVTGRPFTLFHNKDILSSGAVGLCLTAAEHPEALIDYPDMEQVTADLTVTESSGNLIHSLNNENAAKLLYNIMKEQETKGEEQECNYFLSALNEEMELVSCYSILAGDPSRGSIALGGREAPPLGSTVRLYCRYTSDGIHGVSGSQSGKLLELLTVNDGDSLDMTPEQPGEDCTVFENKFQACSENGFVDRNTDGMGHYHVMKSPGAPAESADRVCNLKSSRLFHSQRTVQRLLAGSATSQPAPTHSHEGGGPAHQHGGEHGHTHEHLDNPGKFSERDLPDYSLRNFEERGFTIGIGGPVGSGKTALTLALCQKLRQEYNIATVTNDIFTREDQEFLIKNKALPASRILAIETGGCPHAAIREDISANMGALETLQAKYECQLLFVESGGDNLAANYSRELADYIIYVIDVSGGDKIPRKGGPGISQSDLLVINKIDLAPYVGASLEVMARDSKLMRGDGPTVFTSVKQGTGVDDVVDLVLAAWRTAGSPGKPGAVGDADL